MDMLDEDFHVTPALASGRLKTNFRFSGGQIKNTHTIQFERTHFWFIFLAVQDSSISDIVGLSVCRSVGAN